MKSSTDQVEQGETRRSEQDYVRSALILLRRLGVPSAWEAAVLGRSIDLVYLQDGSLFSVEFKKRDWRRALKQARDHLLGADFAYICLAGTKPSRAFLQAAQELGVGVLAPCDKEDWPFEVLLAAPRSIETWQIARERLIEQLR